MLTLREKTPRLPASVSSQCKLLANSVQVCDILCPEDETFWRERVGDESEGEERRGTQVVVMRPGVADLGEGSALVQLTE